MKKINVAINGFGRIGRSTFKALFHKENINIVAINDLVDPHTLAYLLKFDSIFYRFSDDVRYDDKDIIVDGQKIIALSERNNENLPWGDLDVDVVLESTGIFRKSEQLQKHLDAGAKRVVLSAPPKGEDVKIIVLGINDHDITKDDLILSNASCTTNCLAPMIKVMEEISGIEKGMATTVHAYTADQRLIDSPHSDLRRARAAAINIIPTSTGAAKAATVVFPHLKGKLTASAYRVPVIDGSIADLICTLKKEVSVDEVNHAFKVASETHLKGILEYCTDEIVSSDIIGSTYSSILDSKLTHVNGDFCRVVGWYDNESGYSHRLVDLIVKVGEMI